MREALENRLKTVISEFEQAFAGKLEHECPFSVTRNAHGVACFKQSFDLHESLFGMRPTFAMKNKQGELVEIGKGPGFAFIRQYPYLSKSGWLHFDWLTQSDMSRPTAPYMLSPGNDGILPLYPSMLCSLVSFEGVKLTTGLLIQTLRDKASSLIEKTEFTIRQCSEILVTDKKVRDRALERKSVLEQWPWSIDTQAGSALYILSQLTPKRHKEYELVESWSMATAPKALAEWCYDNIKKADPLASRVIETQAGSLFKHALWVCVGATPGDTREKAPWHELKPATGGTAWPFAGMAALYQAEQEIQSGLREPKIAIDAGKLHHSLISLHRDIPYHHGQKDGGKLPVDFDSIRIYLSRPGKDGKKQPIQLALPRCDSANEAIVHLIKEWRGVEGLRHWSAIQHLLSIEGGRKGFVRWSVDAHLEALGYSASRKRKTEVRDKAAAHVELLTQLELMVEKDGKFWESKKLLHVGSRFGHKDGSKYKLDGMELKINPLLYEGVRDSKTGKLGKNFFWVPAALPTISKQKSEYAIGLGLVLGIRWRWDWQDRWETTGQAFTPYSGQSLLDAAGIKFVRSKPGRAWEHLEKALAALQEIKLVGKWEWLDGEPSLAGICRVWPHDELLDRTIGGLQPLELPAETVPLTGAELKAWRKRKKLTQAELAAKLAKAECMVSQSALSRAEKATSLPEKIASGLRKLFSQNMRI